MADSIDGITVKLSVNSDEFIRNMKQCEGSVDKAEKELSSLEKTTESASKEEQKFGENVNKANKSLKDNATESEKASKKSKDLANESKKMASEFEGAKEALDGVNKILGLFGASIGISALITQTKQLADEAKNAQIAYENMYDSIRYISGSFSEGLKSVTDNLAKKYGLEFADSIAASVGGISTFFPSATENQIMGIAEELITLQIKRFGDAESTLNQLNPVIKKYGINIESIVPTLDYLAKTSEDTGASMSTLLSILEDADEFSKIMFKGDINKTIDFFGDSIWAGNTTDVQGIGSRFERTFNKKVAENIQKYIDAGFSKSVSTDKAVKEVTKLFNDTMVKASKASSQSEASIIWANLLEEQVGGVTNILADLSMANTMNGVSYASRNTQESIVNIAEANKTYEDIQRENEALYESAMNNIQWMKDWTRESAEIENQYIKDYGVFAGKFAAINNDVKNAMDNFLWWNVLLGKSDAFNETFPGVKDFFDKLSDPFGLRTGTATIDWKGINESISGFFGIGTASASNDIMFPDISEIKMPDGLSDMLDSTDDIVAFNEETIMPLNESLLTTSDDMTLINENSVLYNEQTYSLTIPAMQDETTHTNNLAAAWWEAYRAKLAYQSL